MKRHYSRYTPEMVERVCGIPKEKFVQVAKLYCENSGPEKTGTITYALNLTQHTNGVQNIRALCMLQILLGNIGRPGGGVVALRGHANVQGATDLELLYHELPGLPADAAAGRSTRTSRRTSRRSRPRAASGSTCPSSW